MPAVPPGSLVVVTGITGYIGSHVALAALKAGLQVRGTVRNSEKAKNISSVFQKEGADVSKLEIVSLDDLTSEEKYSGVIKGTAGIIHVALPGHSGDRVKSCVDSNLALLRAATKEPSIKRIVLCSSSVAGVYPGTLVDHPLNGDDWNETAIQKYTALSDEEREKAADGLLNYSASKTMAERAAWKFVEEHKPAFDLVAVMPNANFGPMLIGKPASTAEWIYNILNGDDTIAHRAAPQWFLDVRDDAKLHVVGLTEESLGGKRFWGVAEPIGWNKIKEILRKNFPKAKVNPAEIPNPQGDVDKQQMDNSVATSILGQWIPLEQSLVDTGKAFGF